MSWPEALPYLVIAIGVTTFCAALGWRHAVRYVRWINRQMLEASWFKIPAGFRTGGYTSENPMTAVPWHRQENLAPLWAQAGERYPEELWSFNVDTVEYRNWDFAIDRRVGYLVRCTLVGGEPRIREFDATYEQLESYAGHAEVVLSLVRSMLEASRTTILRPGEAIHCTSQKGVRVHDAEVTVSTPPPENHNKPRRLRVRKTK